ncbi:MAG: peptidoglycan DD-metalloendopeptidase family protein [Saprospiraceae bacterium]|nr:peptidoglycan DD-metalloendopeptidase family protein [Saprospiraceae bacterium]
MKGFISLCFLLLVSSLGYGQDKDALRDQRNRILAEIQQAKGLLAETRNATKTTLSDLRLLQRQVEQQENLIRTINSEINLLNREIRNTEAKITINEKELNSLQDNYAKTVVGAYKKRNTYDKLLFVLSAKGFNNAMRRANYLKKYSAHKKLQAETIKAKKKELEAQRLSLINNKSEKDDLLVTQRGQQEELITARAEIEVALEALKEDEEAIKTELAQKQTEADRLNREIERIIAREIEAERQRLAAANAASSTTTMPEEKPAASNTNSSAPDLALTPEAAALANKFSKNEGSLPWPVERGVISQGFGEQKSKDLAGIKTNNNGIDIRTSPNASVRAIFEGEVRSITTIPGYNKVVIVGHGNYFTVYGKLQSVSVEVGQKVETKESLGIADTADGITEVHLEIWKGTSKLNPSKWIGK